MTRCCQHARGRTCKDQDRLLDNIEMFREMVREFGCYDAPRPFASDAHRVAYFGSGSSDRHPDAPVDPESRCRVIVMSGLPAAGKDTWLQPRFTLHEQPQIIRSDALLNFRKRLQGMISLSRISWPHMIDNFSIQFSRF